MRRPTLILLALFALVAGCTVSTVPNAAESDDGAGKAPASASVEGTTSALGTWTRAPLDKHVIVPATGLDDSVTATSLFTDGFEGDGAGWQLVGAQLDCATSNTGDCSIALRDGEPRQRAVYEMPIAFATAGTIEARFAWLDRGRGHPALSFLNAEGKTIGPMNSEAPRGEDGVWTDVTLGPYSVPEGAQMVRLGFYGDDLGDGVTHVDDVVLTHRTLPAGGFANGDFEEQGRWVFAGGARLDCEKAYEGRCSLVLPKSGGAASQMFIPPGASVAIDHLVFPSATGTNELGYQMEFAFYDADGRWVGTTAPRGSGFSYDGWAPLAFSGSMTRAHHVVLTISSEPNDVGDLWFDAMQARAG